MKSMESLISIIRENSEGKESAIEEISSNIKEACSKDELYELSVETLSDIFQRSEHLNYATAYTIVSKIAAKHGKKSVEILSSLNVDGGMSETELETLLSLIPGIPIFSLLGSFTEGLDIDYQGMLQDEKNKNKNLEEEINMKKKILELYEASIVEIKLQKELMVLKESIDIGTKIEKNLKIFEGMKERNLENSDFRDKLQCDINPKKFEESIIKAKNFIVELQKVVDESSKTIKTCEKTQKLRLKFEKKFMEINAKYQKLDKNISAILIGDCMCGKTCLLEALQGKEFQSEMMATIGAVFCSIYSSRDNNKIRIWDTPGPKRLKGSSVACISRSGIVLLCFSKNSRKEFDDLFDFWVTPDMLEKKGVILVKTKIDLEDDPVNDVPREELTKFTAEKNYRYFEISSKTKEGINELRECLFSIVDDI